MEVRKVKFVLVLFSHIATGKNHHVCKAFSYTGNKEKGGMMDIVTSAKSLAGDLRSWNPHPVRTCS